MLFHTTLKIVSGKTDELLYKIKKAKVPEGIKIREFVKAFGNNDFFIFYEAPSEEVAIKFVLQFAPCTPEISLCSPVEISK